MYGSGFTETLDNPNPGKLSVVLRLSDRAITIWEHSADEGIEWQRATAVIGMNTSWFSLQAGFCSWSGYRLLMILKLVFAASLPGALHKREVRRV